MPLSIVNAPAGSTIETRVGALERNLQIVNDLANGALQIPPYMRGGTSGMVMAGGQPMFDSQGLVAVMSVIVNGGTQTGGPITGVAGPPTGLGGVGGEVVLTTATFTLPRQETVMLLAICSDYVTDAGVHVNAHPVYFQLDTVDQATAYGFVPVFTNADIEIRSATTTILQVVTLAKGSHTVNVIWNSQEGANDTIFNGNNPLFVFQLGN